MIFRRLRRMGEMALGGPQKRNIEVAKLGRPEDIDPAREMICNRKRYISSYTGNWGIRGNTAPALMSLRFKAILCLFYGYLDFYNAEPSNYVGNYTPSPSGALTFRWGKSTPFPIAKYNTRSSYTISPPFGSNSLTITTHARYRDIASAL